MPNAGHGGVPYKEQFQLGLSTFNYDESASPAAISVVAAFEEV